MAAFTSQDQRSYIKIEVCPKKSAVETLNALQEACGTYSLLYTHVTRCVKEFKEGRYSRYNHRADRNVTVTDSYNTDKVKMLLDSVGSVHMIIRNRLEIRKVGTASLAVGPDRTSFEHHHQPPFAVQSRGSRLYI